MLFLMFVQYSGKTALPKSLSLIKTTNLITSVKQTDSEKLLSVYFSFSWIDLVFQSGLQETVFAPDGLRI